MLNCFPGIFVRLVNFNTLLMSMHVFGGWLLVYRPIDEEYGVTLSKEEVESSETLARVMDIVDPASKPPKALQSVIRSSSMSSVRPYLVMFEINICNCILSTIN